MPNEPGFWRQLMSLLDFGGSKNVDDTPGGIPFIFLIAIVPILLILILIAGYFILR